MRNNPTGALAAFQKATELDASSVKAHNHLGQAYEALVQYPAARAAYLKAIELEKRQTAKSEWPYFNLGALCLREGRAAEAEGYFRQALERQPGWSEGKAKLGMALLALDRLPEALSYLEQAVQIDPQNADARYQYARLLVKMGKPDEAERHFQFSGNRRNHEARDCPYSPGSSCCSCFLSSFFPPTLLKIPSLGGVARSDSASAQRRAWVGVPAFKNPPEVPLCPKGDGIFIERGAATRHEKLPRKRNSICGRCL